MTSEAEHCWPPEAPSVEQRWFVLKKSKVLQTLMLEPLPGMIEHLLLAAQVEQASPWLVATG